MIIGVVGPIGSGKDIVSDILVEEHAFEKFSLGNALRRELEESGIELTRKNLQDFGDKFRLEKGTDYLAKKVCKDLDKNKNYVFTSFRNPAEIRYLKSVFNDMAVVIIEAPFGRRFDNLQDRNREKDPITFEDFRLVEDRDFGVGQEAHAQQNAGCFEMAMKVIVNNGSIEDLRVKVENLLKELEYNKV